MVKWGWGTPQGACAPDPDSQVGLIPRRPHTVFGGLGCQGMVRKGRERALTDHLLHARRGHAAFLESSQQPDERSEGHRPGGEAGHLPPRHTSKLLPQGPEEEAVCGTVRTRGQEKDQDREWPLHQQLLQAGPVSWRAGPEGAGPSSFYQHSHCRWGGAGSWRAWPSSTTPGFL